MDLSSDTQAGDFTALSLPLGEGDAGGLNVEYDPEFLQLEEEALGKPEVQYGDTITQAVEPNWKLVTSLALPLMQRSRDLRLAMWLTRAQLNLHGIHGLAAGLGLIEGLLVNCWESLHPQLDPDDDHDPLLRINILASLCEPAGLLRDLQDVPLVSARSVGHFSLRDLDLASAEQGSSDTLAMIEGAFAQADTAQLRATEAILAVALARSLHIEQLLTKKVGVGRAIDLNALAALLRRAGEAIRRRLPDTTLTQTGVQEAPALISPPQPVRGEINSREDVRQTIDRLCAYFNTHEPASPVPFLLQRAKKLIDKNFMELLQDLAPDGLAQLAQVSGIRTTND